jgi:hypothetical protein
MKKQRLRVVRRHKDVIFNDPPVGSGSDYSQDRLPDIELERADID